MPDVTSAIFEPSTVTDDGYWYLSDSVFDNNGAILYYGDVYTNDIANFYVNFRNISIPAGSTINSAQIRWFLNWTWAEERVNGIIRVVDEISPDPPLGLGSCENLSYVNTQIEWLGQLSSNDSGAAWTPDISPLIQAIIDKGEWSSGNNILLTSVVTSNTYGHKRGFISWDGRSSRPDWADCGTHYPRLYISYTEPQEANKMGYGMKGHLGISFQQSFGTVFTSSYHWFPIINESLTENIPLLVSEGMRGRFEEGPSFEGAHDIAGDFTIEAHPILAGKLLAAWMGQSSGTLTTSVYTHLFKPKATDWGDLAAVPPMTIEVYRDAGSAHQYYDCCMNQLVIEIAHGSLVKMTGSVVGGKFAKAAKSTPSYLIGSEYTWNQTSISFQGSANGAIDEITQLTITLNNNLEAKGTLDGTKTPNRVKRTGFRTAEIAGTLVFENDQEFDHWRNQAAQPAVITITGHAVTSGYNAYMEFDIPQMKYNEVPVNIGGPGLIEASFSAKCEYKTTSATMIAVTIQNTVSQYLE